MKKLWFLMLSLLVIPLTKVAAQTASVAEDQQIIDLLEEEKLANEVYVALYEKWAHHSFQNISSAEERHLEMMKQLAVNRDLKIPASVLEGKTGIFQNERLQNLYKQLMEDGRKSLADALKVGALIEETDIRDLKLAVAGTKDAAAIQVYTALISASENHLRAFTRNLSREGITYTPQMLAKTDYQAILNGEQTCSGACKPGNGQGKGKGKAKCCSSK